MFIATANTNKSREIRLVLLLHWTFAKYRLYNENNLPFRYEIKNILILLRWYGTSCDIFKDDRILKIDYNNGFKNFKIYNICPQNAFLKFHKRDKK